jgi:putative transposase
VDHEGEVLEVFATKRRDRGAALKFLKRTMKRYGRPRSIVTDQLRSYGAAMKVMGIVERQECGRWFQQQSRELTSAVPATRGCDGEVQGRKVK